MGGVQDTMYVDLLSVLEENYIEMIEGATSWKDYLSLFLTNLTFFIGYGITLFLMGILKVADMSMVSGYLLSRIFLLQVMKFLFPIAVAFSSLKQTSGLLGKWIRMYIGISLLGIVYIGILGFCALAATTLQSSFGFADSGGIFDSYLNMNFTVWGTLYV